MNSKLNTDIRYEIYVTVWGERFVKKFLSFALKSQLAPGNLPILSANSSVLYRIYTDKGSREFFEPEISKLQAILEVEFIYFEDIQFSGSTLAQAVLNSDSKLIKHNVQRQTAHHHIDRAIKNKDTAVILLDSDFIFSNGSFLHLHQQRLAGKKGYACTFLRLNEEKVYSTLLEKLDKSLTGRDLVQIGMANMHPTDTSMFIKSGIETNYPVEIKWFVSKFGFISHCFFPHPLMVIPNSKSRHYFSTMDYELLLRSFSKNEDIYVCQSSDDLMLCKMSSENYFKELTGRPVTDIEELSRFVIANTNIRHRYFFEKAVKYISQSSPKTFEKIENESQLFVVSVYKLIDIILSKMSLTEPSQALKTKSFLGPIEDFLSPQIHSRLRKYLD